MLFVVRDPTIEDEDGPYGWTSREARPRLFPKSEVVKIIKPEQRAKK
jgi:hypothetical protein